MVLCRGKKSMNKFLLINVLVRYTVDYNLLNSLKKLDSDKFDVVIYDYRPSIMSTSPEDDKPPIDSEYKVIEFSFDEYDLHQEQIKKEAQSRPDIKALCVIDDEKIELCDTFFDHIKADLFDDENVSCVYSDYYGVVDGYDFPIFLNSMPLNTAFPFIVFSSSKYIEEEKSEKELLLNFISIHIPEHLYKKQVYDKK